MNSIVRILHLLLAEQVWQNIVLIGQFATPWVSELAQLSIYTDILRCLGSGINFRQPSGNFDLQQYSFSKSPGRQKYTDFGPTLERTTKSPLYEVFVDDLGIN